MEQNQRMIKELEKDMSKLAKKCKQANIALLSKGFHGYLITIEADHWPETEEETT